MGNLLESLLSHKNLVNLYPIFPGCYIMTYFDSALKLPQLICHAVNEKAVPVELIGTEYWDEYWASVVFRHFMREEDQEMSVAQLVEKYPYTAAREIVNKGFK